MSRFRGEQRDSWGGDRGRDNFNDGEFNDDRRGSRGSMGNRSNDELNRSDSFRGNSNNSFEGQRNMDSGFRGQGNVMNQQQQQQQQQQNQGNMGGGGGGGGGGNMEGVLENKIAQVLSNLIGSQVNQAMQGQVMQGQGMGMGQGQGQMMQQGQGFQQGMQGMGDFQGHGISDRRTRRDFNGGPDRKRMRQESDTRRSGPQGSDRPPASKWSQGGRDRKDFNKPYRPGSSSVSKPAFGTTKKMECKICGFSSFTKEVFDKHFNDKRHKLTLAGKPPPGGTPDRAREGIMMKNRPLCKVCNVRLSQEESWSDHQLTAVHRAKGKAPYIPSNKSTDKSSDKKLADKSADKDKDSRNSSSNSKDEKKSQSYSKSSSQSKSQSPRASRPEQKSSKEVKEVKEIEISMVSEDGDEPEGVEHVVAVSGFYCKLCRKFYTDEDLARVKHCKTKDHINKTRKIQAAQQKAAPAKIEVKQEEKQEEEQEEEPVPEEQHEEEEEESKEPECGDPESKEDDEDFIVQSEVKDDGETGSEKDDGEDIDDHESDGHMDSEPELMEQDPDVVLLETTNGNDSDHSDHSDHSDVVVDTEDGAPVTEEKDNEEEKKEEESPKRKTPGRAAAVRGRSARRGSKK